MNADGTTEREMCAVSAWSAKEERVSELRAHYNTHIHAAYCVGTSTNQLRWFRLANRGFVVRGRLGSETSTFDASGDVVETQPYHHVSPEAVERALDRFRGHFFQDVPPPPDGGRASPVAPIQRPVVCHAIACAQLDLPDFSLALGSRACLTSLEQVRQGPFTLEHALPSYRWSWEEASATSRKLADLWGPCIAQVRQEMEHQRALFEGRARYY
ncbi:hypothetical protein IscW_ISCW021275 [Ixodes scapularis]|uniref:tRNA pseudouridine(55) synthase n=1 Tax=Ixodes scapularis TaxID=6945 RepID=B7Q670_IXOSC|nr:hypothetical protein IscW_ISCW021275 [Ixodes scapularis]|eukprot:XP_002402830.1 hypothetical protein IscW_ISCW021275 [Ixodes scapularis]